MYKILVLNGPNLNMLGIREPGIYGQENYDALVAKIKEKAADAGVKVYFYQSNHEGALVDEIQNALGRYDGLIFNPGAYTHYSYAIADALRCVRIPTVEVHISDVDSREEFRRVSVIRELCIGRVAGEGTDGYCRAIDI